MTHDSHQELISAWIDGELDPESAARVRTLLESSPELRELESSLRELSRQMRELPRRTVGRDLAGTLLKELAPASPAARTRQENVAGSPRLAGRRKNAGWKWGIGVAAALAASVTGVILWLPDWSATRPDTVALKTDDTASHALRQDPVSPPTSGSGAPAPASVVESGEGRSSPEPGALSLEQTGGGEPTAEKSGIASREMQEAQSRPLPDAFPPGAERRQSTGSEGIRKTAEATPAPAGQRSGEPGDSDDKAVPADRSRRDLAGNRDPAAAAKELPSGMELGALRDPPGVPALPPLRDNAEADPAAAAGLPAGSGLPVEMTIAVPMTVSSRDKWQEVVKNLAGPDAPPSEPASGEEDQFEFVGTETEWLRLTSRLTQLDPGLEIGNVGGDGKDPRSLSIDRVQEKKDQPGAAAPAGGSRLDEASPPGPGLDSSRYSKMAAGSGGITRYLGRERNAVESLERLKNEDSPAAATAGVAGDAMELGGAGFGQEELENRLAGSGGLGGGGGGRGGSGSSGGKPGSAADGNAAKQQLLNQESASGGNAAIPEKPQVGDWSRSAGGPPQAGGAPSQDAQTPPGETDNAARQSMKNADPGGQLGVVPPAEPAEPRLRRIVILKLKSGS